MKTTLQINHSVKSSMNWSSGKMSGGQTPPTVLYARHEGYISSGRPRLRMRDEQFRWWHNMSCSKHKNRPIYMWQISEKEWTLFMGSYRPLLAGIRNCRRRRRWWWWWRWLSAVGRSILMPWLVKSRLALRHVVVCRDVCDGLERWGRRPLQHRILIIIESVSKCPADLR